MADDEEIAIIAIPRNSPEPFYKEVLDKAFAHGSRSMIMERVLDSKARQEALDLVASAEAAREQMRQQVEAEKQQFADTIQKLCDGIGKMARRVDVLGQSKTLRASVDRDYEAAKALALPDEAEAPESSETMPLARDGDYPAPGLPAPGAEDGALPPELERAGLLGTEPILDPKDLAHPEPKQRPQMSITLA
jgi:hypothetical protein